MEFTIPESLKSEHEELHAELFKAIKMRGRIGNAAKAVAKILHPHFVKEEEYALPPLGLLKFLSEGKILTDMKNVFTMTDKLKTDFNQMFKEHKGIIAELKILINTALEEGEDYAHFAEKLILHARTEEEVLYPASISRQVS